jgi:threonine dehydrogenase-like Zn-dependent dehydrogenase
MRALVLGESLEFHPAFPPPTPLLGEAVVRVRRAGICRTDLELVRGYRGFRGVPGHEFVGTLHALPTAAPGAALPQRPELTLGARVVAEINCVPADSAARTAAERAQDSARTTVGIHGHQGAFADLLSVPLVNLHRVPDGLSDDEAVFVEPLAAACQILEQVAIRPSDRVYVLGDGKLGLLCAQVLATVPCELLCIGRHASKLELLRRRGIPTRLADAAAQLPSAAVVVECTGSPLGFALARRLVRPRGTLVLKSTYAATAAPPAELSWGAALTGIVVDEIQVVGSRCGPFAAALRLLQSRRVEVLPLITARYPLEEGRRAFAHAAQKGVLKVVLELDAAAQPPIAA